MRGLADRTLVLTPAGLVEQWREELERKFGLPTVIARGQGREGRTRSARWCSPRSPPRAGTR